MPKYTVVHHAHHHDEGDNGVYRLIYAETYTNVENREIPNPEYDPAEEARYNAYMDENARAVIAGEEPPEPPEFEAEKLSSTIWRKMPVTRYLNPQEIVWDAGDERWQGREPEDVAAEQQKIVHEVITRKIAEQEQEMARAQNVSGFETVGNEL